MRRIVRNDGLNAGILDTDSLTAAGRQPGFVPLRCRPAQPGEPLFINLPEISAERLESQGGYFGSVLRLVQQRKSRPREFQQLLNRVVQQLETMPEAERLRWLELLSHITALVYPVRDSSEQPKLHETIESSVWTDKHGQEFFDMRRTMADELMEQGARQGAIRTSQQTLVRLLKRRFGDVPAEVSATIRATDDLGQLDEWLDRFATAQTLDDVGIGIPA